MSGLYSYRFSHVRTAASSHIRNTPDIDSQVLSEQLAEHQNLGPFWQILPTCSRLLNQVTSLIFTLPIHFKLNLLYLRHQILNNGVTFDDFDKMMHRSPSTMASSNITSKVSGTGLGSWNSLHQELLFYSWLLD
ncbi:hypothetical protein GQ457_13G027220 [Hibiscus cannabinus]